MGVLERELLLESVIVIDHLNEVERATEFFALNRHKAAVSPITRAEVLAGVSQEDAAATLRRQHRLKLSDALQAALATQHGLQLVTRDVRDLSPERFAFVTVPYAI